MSLRIQHIEREEKRRVNERERDKETETDSERNEAKESGKEI